MVCGGTHRVSNHLVVSVASCSLRPESNRGEVVCPASIGESTKEPPPNVSYHLSKVAPISHQIQVYKSFGTPKKHQKITNIGSKIASGMPRGASEAPRAIQERGLLQQVPRQDTPNGTKRRQDGAKRAPQGELEAHLGSLFRLLARLWGVLEALLQPISLQTDFL